VEKRKLFGYLAERPFLKNGRGNGTPIELFAEAIGIIESRIQKLIMAA
jgi:hypothetical protein